MEAISQTIALFFALAVVMEFALTMIFQHRLYEAHLSGKGLKKPIALVAALFICAFYKLDIFVGLIGEGNPTMVGIVGGAFVLAGGSEGVLNLGRKLGVRVGPKSG